MGPWLALVFRGSLRQVEIGNWRGPTYAQSNSKRFQLRAAAAFRHGADYFNGEGYRFPQCVP
jgi:hypothetical protein